MIIDFHTHAFADKVAKRAISSVGGVAGLTPLSNGTIPDTRKKLAKADVDRAVILPIATKPTQQTVINNWAKEIMSDSFFISFGSVHPDAPDIKEELERIKSLGLYGIKLHPDYQNFFADEKKAFPIYEKCSELGLPITFHMGHDPLSPNEVHSPPQAIVHIAKTFPKLTIIAAHFGGARLWEDAERYLAGIDGNVYIDTSFAIDALGDSLAERIIKKHGAERVLFASDFPWYSPKPTIARLNRLNLSEKEKDDIFFRNAQKLLNI